MYCGKWVPTLTGEINMFIVGRHINGICLNELEFVLDGNGEPIEFPTEEEAKSFMFERGASEKDFDTYLQIINQEVYFA